MESEEFPTLDPVMTAWFSFTIGDYEKLAGQKSKFLFLLISMKLFDTTWKKINSVCSQKFIMKTWYDLDFRC